MEHARRFVDMPANVALIRLTAHYLDDPSQQDESVIRIFHAGSGLERDGPASEELYIIRQGSRLEAMRLILGSKDIASAARVVQQFTDRDFGSEIMVRVVRPPSGNGLIEREIALLHKLKNCDRGEHLVH